MAKLIIGCGYLGLRVARRWLDLQEQVFAISRSEIRAESLKLHGIEPIVADVTKPETLGNLPAAETVLYAVGFDRAAQPSKEEVYVAGLSNVLAALPDTVQRIIYIGSSSVYGQQSGESVDEHSPCEPANESGRICLAAEQTLQQHARWGKKAVTLRLVGIYGPDRVPRQQAILNREPIEVDGEGTLNLIHVDDAASAVIAAEVRGTPGEVYLIADGSPVRRADYYSEIAKLLNAPEPRVVPPPQGSSVAERALSNKRIDNRRMLDQLEVSLAYPSYREGLRSILGK